jgi:hypothetical protein
MGGHDERRCTIVGASAPVREGTALVAFLTCNRVLNLRRYVSHYLAYCRRDRSFDFVVSLDGPDEASARFCGDFGLPLLSSDEREGVGLSKNRVLERFAQYDYYFFVEDDAELLDGAVFREHIRVAQATGLHHLSLMESGKARGVLRQERVLGHRVVFARYGGAQFSFFTRQGLEAVGGWHPAFASYRRFGHTEHSCRFVNRGMADAPFVLVESLADRLLWHYPSSVTAPVPGGTNPATELSLAEEELIAQRLTFFPVTTLSPSRYNGLSLDGSSATWIDAPRPTRYPLLRGADRRRAWADYHAASARQRPGVAGWASLLAAALCAPGNTQLRHTAKVKLRRALRPRAA